MPRQKPAASNDNQAEADESRGEATVHGGNKIHGDDLKGAIPDTPAPGDRPTRDEPAEHKRR